MKAKAKTACLFNVLQVASFRGEDEHDQNDADDTNGPLAEAIAVAPKATTQGLQAIR